MLIITACRFRLAVISGFVICGGVWLSNAAVHGVIWRPHGAPVVRVDVGD
jgi:hypothetical protein